MSPAGTLVERPASAVEELLEGFRSGRIGALSRAISWVENGAEGAGALLAGLPPGRGGAWRSGVTGPPGAGKSTLVDALAKHWARAGRRVALLCLDPTSPLTGGALLGDRVRMDRSQQENGVFVRSMASRGSLGGLSCAAGAAADLLEAFGFAEVILETVGVGQAEVDVAGATDTTVVVLTPSSGDGVQAMKAGLMEVADLFVVNKADLPGAERMREELEGMLSLRPETAGPRPPVLLCSALHEEGVTELADAMEARRAADREAGRTGERRSRRARARVKRLLGEGLRERLADLPALNREVEEALERGERPERVAARIVEKILEGFGT